MNEKVELKLSWIPPYNCVNWLKILLNTIRNLKCCMTEEGFEQGDLYLICCMTDEGFKQGDVYPIL